ncbi:MAG: SHOCT domain-containing protein [Desulfobacterales bacterium]
MPLWKRKEGDGVIKSVMTAYLVLVLHVLLIAGVGILVLFLRGFVHYLIWIVLAGFGLAGLAAWWFFRRMKAEGKNLKETLKSPAFRDQTVEISLLGGLASFRVGSASEKQRLEAGDAASFPQLEDPNTARVRELTELAKLLRNGLISREEYEQAKRHLFED